MYRHFVEPAQVDSDRKDGAIASLKAELNDLRSLEGDYLRLNDQVADLEQRYGLLLDEKDSSEKEQRVKTDLDNQTIVEHREELDSVRVQLQRVNVEIEEVLRENTALKRMSDARAAEIQANINQNRDLEGKNEILNEQNRNFAISIKALKDERNKLEEDCDHLSDLLDKNIAVLKSLERDARNAESNNARLDKTLVQAETDNDKLNADLANRTDNCREADAFLRDLEAQIEELKVNLANLEALVDKHKAEAANHHANWQAELAKGKDLSDRLGNLDEAIRSREAELDDLHAQEEVERRKHFDLLDENKFLNSEIDNCLAVIAEYEAVNRELIDQVEGYIQQDSEAISLLSRHEAMRDIIARTTARVSSTFAPISHLRN